ncbi:MAG: aldo/keto reductase, partial [Candidatus Methylomirabilis sp.]|nr:aldo/keto reductase [Deltaproteobacteria bacterium]
HRPLGATGLTVSEVGFGGWSIGGEGYGPTDDRVSRAALRKAFEEGVAFFDTADTYGDGRGERLIAEALGAERDRVVLATKVGNDFYGPKLRKNFEADYIRFACEQSLRRLGTDRIDLYQLHNPSLEAMRRGEAFEAMRVLVREGKALHWGVSVREAEEARAALAGGAETLQLIYNLLYPQVLEECADEIAKRRAGVIVRTPLEFGLLTGKYRPGHVFGPGDSRAKRWDAEALARKLAEVERYRFLARPPIRTMAEAAVRFALSHPLVSTVIPGVKTPEQAAEHARASGEGPALSEADLARVGEVRAEVRGASAP